MQILIKVINDDIESDGTRKTDAILRDIHKRVGTEALWEKCQDGWKISS